VVSGPGEITAKDIDLPSGVEILNPDAHIATLEKGTKLEVYLTIGRGRATPGGREQVGRPADRRDPDRLDLLTGPSRGLHVEQRRVGQRTDFDKLTLDIETGRLDRTPMRHCGRRPRSSSLSWPSSPTPTGSSSCATPAPPGCWDAALGGPDGRPRSAGPGAERDGRHPDRGAGARRAVLQLPQAGRDPDGRRPGLQDRGRAQTRSPTSARSRSTR